LALFTGAAALMFTALIFVRYATAPDEDAAAGDQTDRLEQAAAVAPDRAIAVASDVEAVPATPEPHVTPVAPAAVAAPIVTERPKKAPTVRPAKSRVVASAKSTAPIAKSTAPIAPPAIAKVTARGDAAAISGQAPVSIENVGPTPVTLTGCLEVSVDRDEFRLSDTDGLDAPRSRSWRTGFLKKRPTPVALVEPPDPRGLQIQVGKRVAATGRLIDRELRVSSVRVVSPSCD
jgi:hypothetical protein